MPRIPVVGIDAAEVVHWCNAKLDLIDERLQDGHAQRRLVLVIVSIALLLDNMLYMVIVPIIPDYLRNINVWDTHIEGGQKVYANEWRTNGTGNYSVPGNKTVTKIINGVTVYEGEDAAIGFLFASKAIIQLMVNPFSGALIDKIGYDVPMTIGLLIMFFSTAVFACGRSYGILFFARSLQGVGSAFADTSGLAMIADRYTEEKERTRALGIALAFISFGCLVAPPFGGLLYEFCGKEFPFLLLALVSFTDAIMLRLVMRPIKKQQVAAGYKMPKGTPIWRLFADPYIALCAGALMMSNVSLAFLEPTISVWMMDNMKGVQEWQLGMIWLPAFFPHVAGVVLTVKMAAKYPQYQWALAAAGLALEGVSCIFIPLATSYWVMMLPICTICFGIALIDTALLPTLGHLVDTRHVSVYGSIYAIADISYSMAYAFGPIIAGGLVNSVGFTGLNIGIAVSNVIYAPLLYILCYVKGSGQSSEQEQINMTDHPKEYHTYATLENDANGQIPHQMLDKPPLQETQMGVGMQPYQGNGGYEPNGIAYGQHGSSVPPYQNADMQSGYQPQQQYQQQQQHYQQQDLNNVYQPPPRPPPPRQESITNANANPFRPAAGANPFRQNQANPFGGGMAPT